MVYHGVGCGVCTAAAGRGGCTSAWAGRYPDEHEKIKTNTFYHRSPMGESYRWFTHPLWFSFIHSFIASSLSSIFGGFFCGFRAYSTNS